MTRTALVAAGVRFGACILPNGKYQLSAILPSGTAVQARVDPSSEAAGWDAVYAKVTALLAEAVDAQV